MSRKTIPTGFTPGPRHKVFGISDDLLNTTRNILMGVKPEAKEAEESEEEADENKQALAETNEALSNPLLREKLFELLNKLVEAIEDDKQIWVRLRKRLLSKGDEDNE